MHLANKVCGNNFDAAVIELSMASVSLLAIEEVRLSICDKRTITRKLLSAGESIESPVPESGARTYVAVAGGFVTQPILGSCSGRLINKGDRLEIGQSSTMMSAGSTADREFEDGPIAIIPGPQADLFDMAQLATGSYAVSLQSNRVGILLDGEPMGSVGELVSEPACVGSIQVNNRGQLMILGPDGPTIGGYPKVAVVRERELSRIAQLRPGERVRFEMERLRSNP